MTFEAEILINGINPYVHVSQARARELKSNWRKPMPVLVRVNNMPAEPWRINMMPVGNGDFYLYLHGYIRDASKTKVGDIISVTVNFDADYRPGPEPLPDWFKKELTRNKTALANWDQLPPSRQKEVARNLLRLKSDEAKQRNLERALYVLSGNDGKFMGRIWAGGK